VLGFFTLAATKLPSYWIPATPAAALLVALAAQARPPRWARFATLALVAVLAVGLALSPRWIPLINDPELPTLPAELLASGLVLRAALWFGLSLVLGLALGPPRWRAGWLLGLQLPLVLYVPTAHLPLLVLGDGVRQLPVRRIAADVLAQRRPREPLAMVGILKPSLHYYARQPVLFEGIAPAGLINLSDRLARERREGWRPSAPHPQATLLVVIDQRTAQLPYWLSLPHQQLATQGLYRLWRVPRAALARQAAALQQAGVPGPDWQQPRPERY
jgi:hypothetical protein